MKIQGFKVTAKYQDTIRGFPNDSRDDMHHNKFRVTITRDGIRRSFSYYGSFHDYQEGRIELGKIELGNTLYCFLSDAQSGEMSFEEFCGDFGYDEDSRSAYKIWLECVKSAKKIDAYNLTEEEIIDIINKLNN